MQWTAWRLGLEVLKGQANSGQYKDRTLFVSEQGRGTLTIKDGGEASNLTTS